MHDEIKDELEKTEQSNTVATVETEPLDQKKLTDQELDQKLQQFKGKKDEKEADLVEEGRLLDDGNKEVVHVGFDTYKRMVDMAGGWVIVGGIIIVQCIAEYFKI